MATRLPASMRTREELMSLIEGRLSTASAKDELFKLATRLVVEEALERLAGDAVGREYYEHGPRPGQGYRNAIRPGCRRRPPHRYPARYPSTDGESSTHWDCRTIGSIRMPPTIR